MAKRVLVVDDTQATLAALSQALTDAGYDVRPATSADEGVQTASDQHLDAVVLDLELHGVDGLAALRRFKALGAPRYIPVLMVSAGGERDTRLLAFKLGADDFLVKPVDAEDLLARLGRALALQDRFDSLAAEATERDRLAGVDSATHAYNRRFFEQRLQDEFRRARRHDDPLALVRLEVDGQPDDALLARVAAAVKKCIRETDLLARTGPADFALLLPKTHLAGALTVAERVWSEVGTLALASLGISGYPNRAVVSADQLLHTAEEALQRGRGKISLYQQASLFSAPAA